MTQPRKTAHEMFSLAELYLAGGATQVVIIALSRSLFRIFFAVEIDAHIALIEALQTENALLRERAEAAVKSACEVHEKVAEFAHERAQLKRLVFGPKSAWLP